MKLFLLYLLVCTVGKCKAVSSLACLKIPKFVDSCHYRIAYFIIWLTDTETMKKKLW